MTPETLFKTLLFIGAVFIEQEIISDDKDHSGSTTEGYSSTITFNTTTPSALPTTTESIFTTTEPSTSTTESSGILDERGCRWSYCAGLLISGSVTCNDIGLAYGYMHNPHTKKDGCKWDTTRVLCCDPRKVPDINKS